MSAHLAISIFAVLSVALLAGCAVIHIEAVRAFERGEKP